MKQNFWSKLKEVSIRDLYHIILFLLAFPIAYIYKKKRRHMWLICENKNEARDNGYWLFRYICENVKEQDIVYAINPKSEDYCKVNDLGNTVTYGTFRHWIYYLAAEINISSQKGGKPNAAVCYFLEVYGFLKNVRVFLQHGIVKDDLPFLHFENSKMKMFVTSTEREFQYVKDNFNYPPGAVQMLGLCRFDNLHGAHADMDKILVMPTWRSWISPPSNARSEYEGNEAVQESEYYQGWNTLLQSKRLRELLKKNHKYLIFYQHREMQKFDNLFQSPDDNIIIADDRNFDVQDLLMTSAYLITDYSSIAMDFAYMGKPMSYYQFDYVKFREQQYTEGYFSYEKDGFGPVCYSLEQLLEELNDGLKTKFQNPSKYKARMETFFTLKDNQNCKRNYEAIRKLTEEGKAKKNEKICK